MLKLTDIDGKTVYAAVKFIEWMIRWPDKTEVRIAGSSHLVTETPEEILAMPEMMESMYPAMVVPKGFTWDEYNSVVADLKAR